MYRFFLSLLFLLPITSFAQDPIEREMNQMMFKGGFKQTSLQYGELKEHEAMFRDFWIKPTHDYIIVAYGEKGVLDVDVQVLDVKNQELIKDDKSEALALVKFSTEIEQSVKVIVTNFNSESRSHAYVIKYILYESEKLE